MSFSSKAIRRHLAEGTIIISPFREENLGDCSYDIRLGRYYYRETQPADGHTIYNPYSKEDVGRVWGDHHIAQPLSQWLGIHGQHVSLKTGIKLDDLVIWLAPGEMILAHSEEFIGGRERVTTEMKARSSIGRNFLTVCRCAGSGDVGYISRWTMEIENSSRHYHIPLVVGRRIAQILFFETEEVANDQQYPQRAGSKYQTTSDLEELQNRWTPSQMLPKMYDDYEARGVEII